MAALLDIDAARMQLLDGVGRLPSEMIALSGVRGRVLAEDVKAQLTQPPFDAAAMDGYAIRWSDMPGPWRVVGEAAAGHGWGGTLGTGDAARIFTGAPLPAGADTIVVQEEIARANDIATLAGEGPPRAGAHIRRAGQDFAAGNTLASAGARLTAARIGLIAAAGHGAAPVVRRPRVALIATGDELVPPGATPGPDQIISSNGVMLRALLENAGAIVDDPGIVPDRREALAAALQAATTADVIITIGGASVGDHDLVVPVLRDLGAEIDFWKIAMRPGKPMIAGRLASTRVLGLPGNPVSAYVCALLFAVPLLARLGGRSEVLPMRRLPLASALPANGMRRDHLRARFVDGRAEPFGSQDSAMLGRLAAADLLIVRQPGAAPAAAGEMVDCIALDSIGDVS